MKIHVYFGIIRQADIGFNLVLNKSMDQNNFNENQLNQRKLVHLLPAIVYV